MNRSLQGKTVMVTREHKQALPLIHLLEENDAQTQLVPLIKFEQVTDDQTEQQLRNLAEYDWLFFTSTNTVHFFHQMMTKLSVKVMNKIAAVGEKTKNVLMNYGYQVDFSPTIYNGESMVKQFVRKYGKQRIGLICGQNARKEIPELLQELGISFEKIIIYRTIKNEGAKSILNQNVLDVDAVFFTSPSTVTAFDEFLNKGYNKQIKQSVVTVAIGNTTANELRERNFQHIIYPETFTIENMVEAYENYIRKGDK
ncbi:uroporphyrinogen-III synthase [Gracilibacillus sp. S3-1-1]|uniref:Uroporphyrinogen-III synthase n=1 Tax=Gracilibacillus pellucidus TaxID=3095368 RepID=A0ACC6M6Z3_9BACI|nr:uroporphyrinogen-III synthase [Gracilibacillus sp. S3-1-1]MDX8046582.1 uroporphyrinogen-III synthase [Gracilibacillus sp. S3-1-1]